MPLQTRDFAAGIVEVPEDDCVYRAGLLTSCRHFAIPDAAVFLFCGDASPTDSLNAVGALLHDTTPTDGYVRVVHRLGAWGMIIGVLKEVEASDFVRAVVGTKARAHATVIDLKVQTFVIVNSGFNRANEFARSVLAMHAWHGHMIKFGVIQGAAVVSIDADPVHLAIASDLIFADYGNVIFNFTRDEAGVATNAGGKVNGHAPLVAAVGIFVGGVERLVVFRRFNRFFDGVVLRLKFAQSYGSINLAFCTFDLMVSLSSNEMIAVVCFVQGRAARKPKGIRSSEGIRINSDAVANAAGALASKAKR